MSKKVKHRTDRQQGLDPRPKVGPTISYGGYHTWKNLGTMILLSLTYLVIIAIGSVLISLGTGKTVESAIEGATPVAMNTASWLFFISGCIIMILQSLLAMSFQKGFIHTDHEDDISCSDFISFDKNVFMGFVTSIITGVISIAPLAVYLFHLAASGSRTEDMKANIIGIVCFVLFAILTVYLTYAPYYSLDNGTNPVAAIKNSFADVSKYPLYVVGTLVFMTIIYIVSAVFLIPILFTFPMMMVVIANSYRAISKHRVDEAVQEVDREYGNSVGYAEDQAAKDLNRVLGGDNPDKL